MLEEVVLSWWEIRWIWQMRQNFIAQFVQLLKHWLCDVQLGTVVEENWAFSVDQCWLQMLQFLVHLINLLSILLRCNGYAGIQKAVVDQTGSRSPIGDHDPFLVQVWLREVLWRFFSIQPLSWLCKFTFCFNVTIPLRNGSLFLHRIRDDTSKWWFYFFWFVVSSRASLIKLFHLSNLLQMPKNRRMVDVEFFSNFLCSCKRTRKTSISAL